MYRRAPAIRFLFACLAALQVVAPLLAATADVHVAARDGHGATPIHCAAVQDQERSNQDGPCHAHDACLFCEYLAHSAAPAPAMPPAPVTAEVAEMVVPEVRARSRATTRFLPDSRAPPLL